MNELNSWIEFDEIRLGSIETLFDFVQLPT